jgi:hypothetical protein
VTVIDISHLMFTYDDIPVRRRKNYESFETMMAWVEQHIGPQTEQNGFTQEVMRKGQGWEIRTNKRDSDRLHKLTKTSFRVISWHMHIDDEQLATMFALKFSK